MLGVTALLLGQMAAAQAAPGAKKQVKGPRALGLIELLPKGKAKLIPVVILVDGEYYDAGAYKADPVPMALDSGTIYEGYKDGVSQGLLTLVDALAAPNQVWMGEGTWETASEVAAKLAKSKKRESPIPRGYEDMDAPPKLLRRAVTKKTDEAPASSSSPAAPTADGQPRRRQRQRRGLRLPLRRFDFVVIMPAASSSGEAPIDANVPVLKRGKVADESPDDLVSIPSATKRSPASVTKTPATGGSLKVTAHAAKKQQIPVFAAISDADGPQSHSYDFPMKPGEEQTFRTKMLALAGEDVLARDHKLVAEIAATEPAHVPAHVSKHAAKAAQPVFSDVQLRIFDLSSSNEPTIVLSATADVAAAKGAEARSYMVTVVAREDIYGDLHRAFSSVTDAQHLDVIPRMELIDAVDVDGDGRGELLFRQFYDSGTAYVVYRVIGEQVYALFQGTPG